MHRPRTQAENRDYRQQSLLNATVKIVAERGVEGATIARICAQAGASRGMSAHYFSSKEALLTASFEKMFSDALNIKQRVAEEHADTPLEALRQCAAASFTPPGFDQDVLSAWQAFTHASRFNQAYAAIIQQNQQQLQRFYQQRFEQIDDGLQVSATQAANGLLALLDGLWNNFATRQNYITADAAIVACNSYINGCLNKRDC